MPIIRKGFVTSRRKAFRSEATHTSPSRAFPVSRAICQRAPQNGRSTIAINIHTRQAKLKHVQHCVVSEYAFAYECNSVSFLACRSIFCPQPASQPASHFIAWLRWIHPHQQQLKYCVELFTPAAHIIAGRSCLVSQRTANACVYRHTHTCAQGRKQEEQAGARAVRPFGLALVPHFFFFTNAHLFQNQKESQLEINKKSEREARNKKTNPSVSIKFATGWLHTSLGVCM